MYIYKIPNIYITYNIIYIFTLICMQFRALIHRLAETSPNKCLTVQQLVLELDINMSRGWEHFAKLALPGK